MMCINSLDHHPIVSYEIKLVRSPIFAFLMAQNGHVGLNWEELEEKEAN